jgi:hypothetical protein
LNDPAGNHSHRPQLSQKPNDQGAARILPPFIQQKPPAPLPKGPTIKERRASCRRSSSKNHLRHYPKAQRSRSGAHPAAVHPAKTTGSFFA